VRRFRARWDIDFGDRRVAPDEIVELAEAEQIARLLAAGVLEEIDPAPEPPPSPAPRKRKRS